MTKPERLLAVVGVAVVASALLLVMYVRQSNPADAQAAGCAGQRARLGQTLDQVRFSGSAMHSESMALSDTVRTRNEYLAMIATTRRQLSATHPAAHVLGDVTRELADASWILNDQNTPLQQARALLAEDQRELASATPLISEASADVRAEDCPALSLTLARSGWPKDRLLVELSQAARLNSQVSDKLDAALGLILQAQADLRSYSVATK